MNKVSSSVLAVGTLLAFALPLATSALVAGSTISGTVYNDRLGDGHAGVPAVSSGLSGWTVTATASGAGATYSVVTGSDGTYNMLGVADGTYNVCETLQTGWTPSWPGIRAAIDCYSVVISSTSGDGPTTYTTSANNNFGNWYAPVVSGISFTDTNDNQSFDAGDATSSGWLITATPIDGSGATDITRTVKTTNTDATTGYSFTFDPTQFGDWRISETPQEGWVQTLPNGDPNTTYIFTAVSSSTVSGDNFGNWQAPRALVMKWSDLNNNGIRDSGEPALANWPFAVAIETSDEDESPVSLSVRAVGTTDSSGQVYITLPSGAREFYILEGKQSGWTRTYPTGASAFGSSTPTVAFDTGLGLPVGFTLDTGTYFRVTIPSGTSGVVVSTGTPGGFEAPLSPIQFGNFATPAPTPPSGGGNGPIAGSLGTSGGAVLGASTTTVPTTITPAPSPTVSTSCSALLTSYMRYGKKNDSAQVTLLQQFLKNHGYTVNVTGTFDLATLAAVKAFQKDHLADVLSPWGITDPTGYVYKTTLYEINKIACPTLGATAPQV
jgi:hypothetical protein